jgi:hypothetical protein
MKITTLRFLVTAALVTAAMSALAEGPVPAAHDDATHGAGGTAAATNGNGAVTWERRHAQEIERLSPRGAADAEDVTWGGPGMHADYVPQPASAPSTGAERIDRGIALGGADVHSDYPVDAVAVPPAPPSLADVLAWGGPGMHADVPAIPWRPAVPPNHVDAHGVATARFTSAPARAPATTAPVDEAGTRSADAN